MPLSVQLVDVVMKVSGNGVNSENSAHCVEVNSFDESKGIMRPEEMVWQSLAVMEPAAAWFHVMKKY